MDLDNDKLFISLSSSNISCKSVLVDVDESDGLLLFVVDEESILGLDETKLLFLCKLFVACFVNIDVSVRLLAENEDEDAWKLDVLELELFVLKFNDLLKSFSSPLENAFDKVCFVFWILLAK